MRMFERCSARPAGRIAAVFCALCAFSAAARGAASPDSLVRFVWGADYTARLAVLRSSAAFPWNDEESSSHLRDRFVAFGEIRPRGNLSIFLKGASGRRLDGWDRENRFVLYQGPVAMGPPGGGDLI